MASGSSGRANSSGSKAFDFGSDDILCSYEDYGNQDGNNGIHSDPSSATNSTKEFNKSRMARSSVFPAATYSPPEESSFNQGVITTVENTMKKYTDNIMRFLEGISSRMSQLELYCYNLDKSIGEMRSDLLRDHGESESKLKSLEKHIQEVHRSVQILRDKQELADTQKELAKLQLAQKESSLANNNQQNEDRASTPASEVKKARTHQIPMTSSWHLHCPTRYLRSPLSLRGHLSISSLLWHPHHPCLPKTQYLPAQSQVQDLSRMPPPPTQPQVNQSPQVQSLPPYQQQWAPQLQQPVPSPQQPVMQPQIRTSSQVVYSSYLPNQPNQSPAEMVPNSMPMQVSFVGAPQPGSTGPEATYGYGSAGRPIQQQPPPQHLKPGYGSQSGEGYVPSGPRSALPPGNTYMVFDGEGGRTHHPPPQPHFQQNAYPPQRMPSPNMVVPHSMRSHPYNELIEKLVGMGYRGDHIVGVIQRLEESGQTIDFNSVLDRLNGHPTGGSQRVWSS
ncbi:UNVERIFIED_CONTAM: hypothetical protein Sangu_3125100 [Sesamum angustifolium]|uniref:DUF1421 domain-containing protein n=1 Tax=Sesamum angustifolium TaxID=2727405 RepID=A0AAW2K175_9LAMI